MIDYPLYKLIKYPFELDFDHTPSDGDFVCVSYYTQVEYNSVQTERMLVLMWLDGNGCQLASQNDNLIDVELNEDNRIMLKGVDSIW